jgi:hypothetical protein
MSSPNEIKDAYLTHSELNIFGLYIASFILVFNYFIGPTENCVCSGTIETTKSFS